MVVVVAVIESADGATVGKPAQSIQWSSLSDDDDAVFDFTSNLTMTSAVRSSSMGDSSLS